MLYILLIIVVLATLATAWLPESQPTHASLGAFSTGTAKIRGVNAGSQYIVEPWMVGDIWSDTLKCKDTESERQCVEEAWEKDVAGASQAWQQHWNSWITQGDIQTMVSYGLNTIRIPVGFWMKEDLLNVYEHFPKGGMDHLRRFCGWASEAGMYIIIDFHGLPGRQAADAFTGDTTIETLGFYQSNNESERAYEFLEWMVEHIHNNDTMRNVGAIELINEPIQKNDGNTQWMVKQYYTSAVDRINHKEEVMHVPDDQKLSIVVMDRLWDSGPPAGEYVDSPLLFDDHNYQEEYIRTQCNNDQNCALDYTCKGNRLLDDGEDSKFVGEWSMNLSISQDQNDQFYREYFTAQQIQYEKTRGWVFWSWRAQGFAHSWLWSYKDAVNAGIIEKKVDAMLDHNPCGRFAE